jgi:S-adenosylmethionine:tRNA ribosyltransferase-isomerase
MINLEDFDYKLPKERIAQVPAAKRDQSKLLLLLRDKIKHSQFSEVIDEIRDGDLIIVNNSRVIAANLRGQKETGGKVECLFLREVDAPNNVWECLLKGRKLRPGSTITFLKGRLIGKIISWKKFGQFNIKFTTPQPIRAILKENGSIKLPPYIKTKHKQIDRYQTVYSQEEGSIAAPTAGLHFTPELIRKIEKLGAKFAPLTLHVGYSTFMPLNQTILRTHKMDPEYFIVPPASAELIKDARFDGNRIIVVGTTTLKTLESATNEKGELGRLQGWSNLFISPGYKFRAKMNYLITNFHMPQSSPLLMVCAFAGRERIFKAYHEALSRDYRFYSFGDAMFIEKL